MSNPVYSFIIRMLASGFFISLLPAKFTKNRKFTGAGFMGTLLALALVPLLPRSSAGFYVFLALFTALAIYVSGKAEFGGPAAHDDPRIVIDEVAGYWFAIASLPHTSGTLAACFIMFRFFDTVKPFGINRLEKAGGGTGIVADDIASGIAANMAVRIFLAFTA